MKASYNSKRGKTNSRRRRTRKTTGGGGWLDWFSMKTPEQKNMENENQKIAAKKIYDDAVNAAKKIYDEKLNKIDPPTLPSVTSEPLAPNKIEPMVRGGKRRRKSKKAQ
jgi:hypothetical protein